MQKVSGKVSGYDDFSAECRVSDKFRVECNFGSWYFNTIVKAYRYFDKCKSKHLDVELWFVEYSYHFRDECYSASQELLDYSGTYLPKG